MSLLEETGGASPADVLPALDLSTPELYQNRELSWLDFNQRVLEEAKDPRVRLLERIRFAAITSSNLDEFYAKRVGWLHRQMRVQPQATTIDGATIASQAQLVRERCVAMRREVERLWTGELAPALAREGIEVVSCDSLEPIALDRLRDYFTSSIYPILTPLIVDPAHPFPFISSETLSLALTVRQSHSGEERFARVKVPQNRPRFVAVDERRFVRLEELIAINAGLLFPGMELVRWSSIRVLRTADIGSPGEDAEDLLELVEAELRRRRLAEAVALELVGDVPAAQLEMLLHELGISESDVDLLSGPLRLTDLSQLADLPLPGLAEEPFTPAVPGPFSGLPSEEAVFSVIRDGDVMVHHPYESFDQTVSRFIDIASEDPNVLAIKHTMYRTSPDSPILESLIDAAGRGKQVAVLVELTARFDEATNIDWARKLENAGVHVAYGTFRLKTHCKISLIVREEPDGVRMYAHVGTGNYNSRTARVYTDLGLFTAAPSICGDLVRIFNHLTGSARLESRELLVAPANLRDELEWRVRREIDHAKAGRKALLRFKMNALEDQDFTRLLYEASQAGVRVELVIRGICRIRPGVPGLSDNIVVRSVIGRFLEHSRIYMFGNGGDSEYYIGSADLMKRNLDERIEVLTPIRSPALQDQLSHTLDVLLSDERQGWELRDTTWSRDASVEEPGTHAILLAEAPFS
ncbi:MAG: polyphosphate kinase 1 [Dehalococcoidia bacterium]|nr:polyphosphate kinase 1 [Dehalococcoidia bacterium]